MVYLGADHRGFGHKEELKAYLAKHKVVFRDLGDLVYKKTDNYPEIGLRVARKIGAQDLGILICGSGNGMAIVANKVKGIRAAIATSVFMAGKAREDDHANILVLSAWETTTEQAKRIVARWLSTRPSRARRHLRRLKILQRLER